jgi:phosphate transport system protein
MPTSAQGFTDRLLGLKSDLVGQGRRVQALAEAAFEAAFDRDPDRARAVIARDDEVDRVDVEVEKASVLFLTDATREGAALTPDELRGVLTIVKVNNELERIADAAVEIAGFATPLAALRAPLPDTFRVMTNSVVGILRDVNTAYERADAGLAKVVLQSEDAVEAFKDAILRDAESCIACGTMTCELAFTLHEVANQCERMADHCTNIAEQVIYSSKGTIVRHAGGKWVEVPLAAS